MTRKTWIIAATGLLAVVAIGYATRGTWSPQGAVAQAPQNGQKGPQQRVVPVEVATVVRKPMPVQLDALGTVMPIASVALKSRVETQIAEIHFQDGASVKQGDLLFTLDSRQLEAQLHQAEGVLARDRAQLAGAERDFARYTDLVAKNATTQVNLDNARTQTDMLRATVKADESQVENLKVQVSYTRIRAPISGRISAATLKVGNLVRSADTTPLATVNQMAPIYVAFAVPQRVLAEVREAAKAGGAKVEAFTPGDREPVTGTLAMLDNAVDATTGMMVLRAVMDNRDEVLWPGTLVNTRLTLRVEDAVVVPSAAVQSGQGGTYVFVVASGGAKVRPVKVERTVAAESVVASGLAPGDVVVVDGQLLLTDGARVAPRQPKKAGT